MDYYFIFGHPNNLVPFSVIADIIKKRVTGSRTTAIIYRHKYLEYIDGAEFLKSFDTVRYVSPISYSTNPVSALIKYHNLKNELADLAIGRNSIVFVFESMELIINLLLKYFKTNSNGTKILSCFIAKDTDTLGAYSWPRTLRDNIYSFMLDGYYTKSYVDQNGTIMHRKYNKSIIERSLYLGLDEDTESNDFGSKQVEKLTYPLSLRKSHDADKRKKVIFFGDATYFEYYPKVNKTVFYEKMNLITSELRRIYAGSGSILYYKPHPLDKDKMMENIDFSGFELFKERMGAEMIYSKYSEDIIAVYSVSSTSVLFSTKFGIPSYTLYKLCCSDEDSRKIIGKIFGGNNSEILKNVEKIGDIGSIDQMRHDVDTSAIEDQWAASILKISGNNNV